MLMEVIACEHFIEILPYLGDTVFTILTIRFSAFRAKTIINALPHPRLKENKIIFRAS